MAVDIDGVNSTISTDKLIPQSGTALQIGESGDTVTLVGSAVGFGGGKVLTVNYDEEPATQTSSSTSWTLIATVTITPASSGSKFLLLYEANMTSPNGGGTVAFFRDSTNIGAGTVVGSRIQGMTQFFNETGHTSSLYHGAGQYLDEPATASEIVYTFKWRTNGSTSYLNRSFADPNTTDCIRPKSSMTVIEIGA